MNHDVRIIEIHGVEFQYPSNAGEYCLRLAIPQLQIDEGEVVVIIGANGSGKSTLCKLLTGILRPSSIGQQFTLPIPSAVLVWQEHELFPLTVEKNLHLVCGDSRTVDDLLFRFGLAPKRIAYPWQLSGGEREKVAIARALAVRQRRALVFDEPTQAIDAGFVESIALAIRDVATMGKAVVLVTHDNRLISLFSDQNPKVYVLEPRSYVGEKIERSELVGPFEFRELFQHPPTPYAAQFCGYQNLFHLTSHPLTLGNLEPFKYSKAHGSKVVVIPEDAIEISPTWTGQREEKEVLLASKEFRSGRRCVVKYRWSPQGIRPLEFYLNWDASGEPPQKAYLSIIGERCIEIAA